MVKKKLVFLSNTFGHYQIPLCSTWNDLCDFTFVTTKPMPEQMKRLGFTDWSKVYPYVLNAWESEESRNKAMALCEQADIVIAGACDELYLKKRLSENKLTFRFTERLFKKGKISLLKPKNFKTLYEKHISNRKKNYYVLCTGADAPKDFRFLGLPKDRLLKWGYFPAVPDIDVDALLKARRERTLQIIWVGRFVALKKPEMAIRAAAYLKEQGIPFAMQMLGIGPLEDEMRSLVRSLGLQECVSLPGSKPAEEVITCMEQSDIFMMNSDKQEGWGAVISEAMGSGCACVVSDEAGAARVLVKQDETGIYYPCRDQEKLNRALYRVATDTALREKLSRNAYAQMKALWNGAVAAERLLRFSEELLENGSAKAYPNGPVSLALGESND